MPSAVVSSFSIVEEECGGHPAGSMTDMLPQSVDSPPPIVVEGSIDAQSASRASSDITVVAQSSSPSRLHLLSAGPACNGERYLESPSEKASVVSRGSPTPVL